MSLKELKLQFIPTQTCLQLKLNQEFSDAEYALAFFSQVDLSWQTTHTNILTNESAFFFESQEGNSIPMTFKSDDNLELYLSLKGESPKINKESLSDKYGVFLYSGSNVAYANTLSDLTDLKPLVESFSATEQLFWESNDIYFGTYKKDVELLLKERPKSDAISKAETSDRSYIDMSNTDLWAMQNTNIEMVSAPSPMLILEETSAAIASSFPDFFFHNNNSEPETIGGIFLSTGTTPDDLILYSSYFYEGDRQTPIPLPAGNFLNISVIFNTELVII